MELEAAKMIGAGLAAIALAGAGVGIGLIFGNYLSGMLAEKEGKINEAIEYYQSVEETDRENTELLRKLHLLSLKDGQFKNAVKYATKIKEHTHNPLSQTTLLVNALSKNQFVDAILILESIPDSALSKDIKKIILAWCFAGQKNFNLAMNALEDIEDSEKNLLIKNLNIALLLDAFGKKDLAKIKFDVYILEQKFGKICFTGHSESSIHHFIIDLIH